MYCENEHLNPSAKHEQCSFQIVMQGHSLDWIPWCISFFLLLGILCLAWNFLLSVQKRKAEIALNSFMMESEDGTMVFKWLVCQKIPLHIFYSLLWKKFSLHKPVVFFSFYIANMYGNLMILCWSRLFTFMKKGGITPLFFHFASF